MGRVTRYTAEEGDIIYACARAGMRPMAISAVLAEKGYHRHRDTIGNGKRYDQGRAEHVALVAASQPKVEVAAPIAALFVPSLPFRTITKTFDGQTIPPVSVARFSFDEMAA